MAFKGRETRPGSLNFNLAFRCGYPKPHPNLKIHLFKMIQCCYSTDEVLDRDNSQHLSGRTIKLL